MYPESFHLPLAAVKRPASPCRRGIDVVAQDMAIPAVLASPSNPANLTANLPELERLLAHNRQARIVWAHAGSDMLGHWTVELSSRMLKDHPNLYMSLRMGPGRQPQNHLSFHRAGAAAMR